MNPEKLTDPRESPFSLLLQVKAVGKIEDAGSEVPRDQLLAGEILVKLERALDGATQRAEVERLGLYSLETPEDTTTGELGVRHLAGGGELIPDDTNRWRLEMRITTRLIYAQIADPGDEPPDHDSELAPEEIFTGSISLLIEVVPGAPFDERLRVVSGRLFLNEKVESLGDLVSVSLPLGSARAFAIKPDAILVLSVKLVPVVFPLASGYTGMSWPDQLCRARNVWRNCEIRFVDEPLLKSPHNLAHSTDKPQIEKSHQIEGAIEIYHVASALGGSTYPRGSSRAAVIIPENEYLDDHLLAHELGHVLGLCHPTAEDGPYPLGTYDSILDVTCTPFKPANSNTNCRRAREPCIELVASS